ncbi:MAG: helix-turn-helix domain-containing protein [Candidatus Gastranaerophilales bacterium]|nr:helix-turn-helix domain-containing protein [Candidatus Gastranaerophilales bacterium]
MEKTYTTKELTKMLSVCRQTLYKDIKTGLLAGERWGRGYKFTDEDIVQYRAKKRTTALNAEFIKNKRRAA